MKRFKVPSSFVSSLPLPKPTAIEYPTLYSLFMRVDNRWNRVRTTAYPERSALIVWGAETVANPYSYSIRPVKVELNAAQ